MPLLRNSALACLALLIGLPAVQASEPTADDIMQKNFYATKIKRLASDSTMLLTNEKGQTRERKAKTWLMLQDNGIDANVVVHFELPADVRGTKFLQLQHGDRDDDMWIYLPAAHKSRRLVSSNKKDSFVGTDFAYADILPLQPIRFHHSLVRSETLNGVDHYLIESIPKDDALARDLGYAKRVSWVRKDNFVESRIDYCNANGKIERTQTASDPKLVEPDTQRWLVTKREMLNRRNNHRTSITVDKFDLANLAPRLFTVEWLERD